MACVGLETLADTSITGLISYPTNCDPYFYTKIFVAIWLLLAWFMYRQEENKFIKSDLLASLAVSAIAVLFLSFIGSLIGMFSARVLIEMIVGGLIFIVLWLIKR